VGKIHFNENIKNKKMVFLLNVVPTSILKNNIFYIDKIFVFKQGLFKK